MLELEAADDEVVKRLTEMSELFIFASLFSYVIVFDKLHSDFILLEVYLTFIVSLEGMYFIVFLQCLHY